MSELLLEVEDLTVSFGSDAGRVQVLDRVAFDMRRGEIVGLVGESGSGKTTLARAILGILASNAARIESGSIRFDGEDLLKADATDIATRVRGRVITFVPQDPFTSFNPVFTIGSQIMELMKWKSPLAPPSDRMWRYPRSRRSADRAKILDLLKTVQLPDPNAILAKYPHEVSGGQRQRLMIAMALLTEPKLIIADEPTTALDVTIQAQILRLLAELQKDLGLAILLITHDLGIVARIADRVSVMYAGEIVESATAEELFRSPRHPYTSGLLSCVPVPGKSQRDRPLGNIPGVVPAIGPGFSGCAFRSRCSYAEPVCDAAIPRQASSPTHNYLCRLEPSLRTASVAS